MAWPKADPERFGKIAKDPFSWMSERGTMFTGTHDLSDGVNVSKPKSEVTLEEFFCFGAWHALHIWGDLNGFSGYDCVKFNYAPEVFTAIECDEDECDPEEYNHEPHARCQCEGCCAKRTAPSTKKEIVTYRIAQTLIGVGVNPALAKREAENTARCVDNEVQP